MDIINYLADIIPFSAVFNMQTRTEDTADMKKYWGKIIATVVGGLLIGLTAAGATSYTILKITEERTASNTSRITILEERQFKHLTTNGIHK